MIRLPAIALAALIATPLLTGAPGLSAAEELPSPTQEVILQVSGAIAQVNDGDTATFDMEMLRGMEAVTFTTTTPWTEGPQDFTGVPLAALAAALDAEGRALMATAINDYAVEIPLSDAVQGGPIVAYERNGAPMSVRDKGPLWIVYPFDSRAEYQSEVIYSRSIWQVDRIEVIE